jgi:hypothetical protein
MVSTFSPQPISESTLTNAMPQDGRREHCVAQRLLFDATITVMTPTNKQAISISISAPV